METVLWEAGKILSQFLLLYFHCLHKFSCLLLVTALNFHHVFVSTASISRSVLCLT